MLRSVTGYVRSEYRFGEPRAKNQVVEVRGLIGVHEAQETVACPPELSRPECVRRQEWRRILAFDYIAKGGYTTMFRTTVCRLCTFRSTQSLLHSQSPSPASLSSSLPHRLRPSRPSSLLVPSRRWNHTITAQPPLEPPEEPLDTEPIMILTDPAIAVSAARCSAGISLTSSGHSKSQKLRRKQTTPIWL